MAFSFLFLTYRWSKDWLHLFSPDFVALKEKSTPSCISASVLWWFVFLITVTRWAVIISHTYSGAVSAVFNIRDKHPVLGSHSQKFKKKPFLLGAAFCAVVVQQSYRKTFIREKFPKNHLSLLLLPLNFLFLLSATLYRSLFEHWDVKTKSHLKNNSSIFKSGPCF